MERKGGRLSKTQTNQQTNKDNDAGRTKKGKIRDGKSKMEKEMVDEDEEASGEG